jgi:hypothetical protein
MVAGGCMLAAGAGGEDAFTRLGAEGGGIKVGALAAPWRWLRPAACQWALSICWQEQLDAPHRVAFSTATPLQALTLPLLMLRA